MAESYGTVTASKSGQNVESKKKLPKKDAQIVYENDTIYIDPATHAVWYMIKTTPERCGTFKLTATDEVELRTETGAITATPHDKARTPVKFSVVLYLKDLGLNKMQLVGEFALTTNNSVAEVVLDLKYDNTYFLQYNWDGELKQKVFHHSITAYYDKAVIFDVASWVRETPAENYAYIWVDYKKNAYPRYDQVFYLDKNQVATFITSFFMIKSKFDEVVLSSPVSLKDLIVTLIAAVAAKLAELLGATGSPGFFLGIGISLFVSGTANGGFTVKPASNENGSIEEQMRNFWEAHVKRVQLEEYGPVVDISDVGMKINVRYKVMSISFGFSDISCDLVEVWDTKTGNTNQLEGPRYYRGRLFADKQILGTNVGLDEESLKTVFGVGETK